MKFPKENNRVGLATGFPEAQPSACLPHPCPRFAIFFLEELLYGLFKGTPENLAERFNCNLSEEGDTLLFPLFSLKGEAFIEINSI